MVSLAYAETLSPDWPVPLPLKNGEVFYNALALRLYQILCTKHCERLAMFYMVVVLDSQGKQEGPIWTSADVDVELITSLCSAKILYEKEIVIGRIYSKYLYK